MYLFAFCKTFTNAFTNALCKRINKDTSHMSYCLWVPCVIIVLNTILIQKASKLLHDPSITTTLLPVHTFINQCQKDEDTKCFICVQQQAKEESCLIIFFFYHNEPLFSAQMVTHIHRVPKSVCI